MWRGWRETPPQPQRWSFFYDTGKILLPLLLMIDGIGWLRAGLEVERERAALSGKGCLLGYAGRASAR